MILIMGSVTNSLMHVPGAYFNDAAFVSDRIGADSCSFTGAFSSFYYGLGSNFMLTLPECPDLGSCFLRASLSSECLIKSYIDCAYPGVALDGYYSYCYQCPVGCFKCSSRTTCLNCFAGYNLSGGSCVYTGNYFKYIQTSFDPYNPTSNPGATDGFAFYKCNTSSCRYKPVDESQSVIVDFTQGYPTNISLINWQVYPFNISNNITSLGLTFYSQQGLPFGALNAIKLLTQLNTPAGEYTASSYISVTYSPYAGNVTVSPASGIALSTQFTISTQGWIDPMGGTLKYTYFYRFESNGTDSVLMSETSLTSFQTVLPSGPTNGTLMIYVVASNNYEAKGMSEDVAVYMIVQDTTAAVSKSRELLSNVVNTDVANVRILSTVTEQLAAIGSSTLASPCPSCSGNGYCQNNAVICTCNPGYTLDDCSQTIAIKNSVINTKLEVLSKIKNIYTANPTPEVKEAVLSILVSITRSSTLNNDNTLGSSADILENSLEITKPKATLDLKEAESVSNILNNMIYATSQYDCRIQSDFTYSLKNRSYAYLNVVSENNLRSIGAADSITFINTQFDVLTKKASVCNISGILRTSEDSPELSIVLDYTPTDCEKVVEIKYYVFRDSIYSCPVENQTARLLQTQTSPKGTVMLEVNEMGTKKPVTEFQVLMKLPKGVSCFSDCTTDSLSRCVCAKLGLFDVKAQLDAIFRRSNIAKLANFGLLFKFPVYESFIFWALVAFSLFYLLSLVVIKRRMKDFSILEDFKTKIYKTKAGTLFVVFIVKMILFLTS